MSFSLRMAQKSDAAALVPLWKDFCRQRARADPSMIFKERFNWQAFSTHMLSEPLSYCLLLLRGEEGDAEAPIAGFLSFFYFDESPPGQDGGTFDNPFEPRRCCNIFGIYVRPEYRKQGGAGLLLDAWLEHVEQMQASDVDVLISSDQKGLQEYFRHRPGFTEAAVQFTYHRSLPRDVELPSLHPPPPPAPRTSSVPLPAPQWLLPLPGPGHPSGKS